MRGRKPDEYQLQAKDRLYLRQLVLDGQLIQRVAMRARVLLALDRGERLFEIVRWLGISRTVVWELWQRYAEHGVEAIFDAERSGRPPLFSPSPTGSDHASGLRRPDELWIEPDAVGLSLPAASSDRRSPC